MNINNDVMTFSMNFNEFSKIEFVFSCFLTKCRRKLLHISFLKSSCILILLTSTDRVPSVVSQAVSENAFISYFSISFDYRELVTFAKDLQF